MLCNTHGSIRKRQTAQRGVNHAGRSKTCLRDCNQAFNKQRTKLTRLQSDTRRTAQYTKTFTRFSTGQEMTQQATCQEMTVHRTITNQLRNNSLTQRATCQEMTVHRTSQLCNNSRLYIFEYIRRWPAHNSRIPMLR